MFGLIARKVLGTANDRRIKGTRKTVAAINALEPQMAALSDDALRGKTQAYRDRLKAGETLDALLPEAFATVREAAKRALGLRPFDVQMIGGIMLHEGSISEMKTGEGKTLVATLPVYLNALTGKGVHVVTVNDYLARRDAEWMGKVYGFLGLTTGVVAPGVDDAERRRAYAADVTYATNNELGFDYLRDNMKYRLEDMVQRGHAYAIVDEVDSILIDEARTPLIISGPTQDQSELYKAIDKIAPGLKPEHYELDEKQRTCILSEDGNDFVEQQLRDLEMLTGEATLYDPENVTLVHHVNQALRAHKLFTRDKDYIVKNDKVIIIDEFTGRMMDGRRWGDGLHQAVEAKEGVSIQPENVTMASITFQNYFRLYEKLGGMTGTALTEAEEFMEIYGLGVVEVPTNRPVARVDEHDQVYRTAREKYEGVVRAIKEANGKGQPILVGTTSIEKSEFLSNLLKSEGVPHNVLNARQHEQEAQIIADAGKFGAVTIATNMAGRGTDIQLGGNVELKVLQALAADPSQHPDTLRAQIEAEHAEEKARVIAAGGLFVLATERHESRRIDNQLRGRSGRQGDPGRSSFFLSLEDDLMRIFGSERLDKVLSTLGMKEGEAIVHPWVNKSLERAQANPTLASARRIANALKVPLHRLLVDSVENSLVITHDPVGTCGICSFSSDISISFAISGGQRACRLIRSYTPTRRRVSCSSSPPRQSSCRMTAASSGSKSIRSADSSAVRARINGSISPQVCSGLFSYQASQFGSTIRNASRAAAYSSRKAAAPSLRKHASFSAISTRVL